MLFCIYYNPLSLECKPNVLFEPFGKLVKKCNCDSKTVWPSKDKTLLNTCTLQNYYTTQYRIFVYSVQGISKTIVIILYRGT